MILDDHRWPASASRRSCLINMAGFATLTAVPVCNVAKAADSANRSSDIMVAAHQVKADAWRLPRGLRSTRWLTPAAASSIDFKNGDEDQATAAFALFLSGSQIMFSGRSTARPVAGFYNPVLDLWWLTIWQNGEQVTAAKFLPAPLFSDGDTPVPWRAPVENLSPRRTLIETLRLQSQRAKRNFHGEFPVEGSGGQAIFDRISPNGSALSEIGNRIAAVAAELSQFAADRPAYVTYVRLTTALAMSAPEPIDGLSEQADPVFARISSLPQGERAMLVPVAAWRIEDIWLIASAAPASAGTLVLAALTRDPSSPIHRLAMIAPLGV